MEHESYDQFKVRVTDGQNLSEVDPVPLYESLKSERSDEVSSGEVSSDREKLIVEGDSVVADKPSSFSSTKEPEPVSYEAKTERMKVELALRNTCMLEHAFASIMGILAGIGAYVVTKEFARYVVDLFLKYFAS